MIRLFSNALFITILIIASVCGGAWLGFYFEPDPNSEVSKVTYGFIAFAVLPITICLFGLKELNGIYSNLMRYLKASEQGRLITYVNNRYNWTVCLALAVVLIQVVFAFALLIYYPIYEFVILGILFGGIISVLLYGLFVSYSVRRVIMLYDKLQTDAWRQKKIDDFVGNGK